MSAIKSMPLWKWVLLLVAGLLLSMLLYGFSGLGYSVTGWQGWILSGSIASGMLGLYALFVRWFERHWPQDLLMRKFIPQTVLGLVIGFLFFVFVAGVLMLVGVYRIDGYHADWNALGDAFFWFLLVAVGEEIIFRGVLFKWIDERFGFWWAIGVSGLLFGLVHWMNPGGTLWASIAIAIEAGVLLGAAYKWSGTLWLPIGIHWAWNFTQGNIFGFAVSGNGAGESLIQATVEGPAWLTGGAFGAEASVITVIAGVLLSLSFLKDRFR